MAQKYVPLEGAADTLGISTERLTELREQGKAHGYRDGASWKFKTEEIDRLRSEGVAQQTPASDELELDSPDELSAGSDSLLLSEVELGDSDTGSASTIIGGSKEKDTAGSDLELSVDSGLDLDLESSSLDLDIGGSDVQLALPSSDLVLDGPGSSGVLDGGPPPEFGSQFENLEELEIDLDGESSRILSADEATSPGGPVSPASSELSLDSPLSNESSASSEIELAGEDDLVLGEGSGSDITLSSGDSGISLLGLSDSGLSLDDPELDLGGSEVESLQLGGEAAPVDASKPLSEPKTDEAAALESGDDFLLTPMEEMADEESDNSGSQVIAIDSEAELDENAVTQLGTLPAVAAVETEAPAAAVMPEGDLGGIEQAAAAPTLAAAAETTFSAPVISGLIGAVLMLTLVMMMMFDLVRNMWSWSQPYTLNSGLMDWLLDLFGIR